MSARRRRRSVRDGAAPAVLGLRERVRRHERQAHRVRRPTTSTLL